MAGRLAINVLILSGIGATLVGIWLIAGTGATLIVGGMLLTMVAAASELP